MDERIIFSEIKGIESILCILGLNFPETATEFQKAALTLAHLTASIRDNVLRGVEIPQTLVEVIDQLNIVMVQNEYKQV